MMKNGVYFIVIAFLVAELFKLFGLCKLDDVTLWTQSDVKSPKNGISLKTLFV